MWDTIWNTATDYVADDPWGFAGEVALTAIPGMGAYKFYKASKAFDKMNKGYLPKKYETKYGDDRFTYEQDTLRQANQGLGLMGFGGIANGLHYTGPDDNP